uniref:Uncharacterized protein n=1 Tax=Hucho hucho TaxID=62062 RepID=A0A4W5Q037_9TELE
MNLFWCSGEPKNSNYECRKLWTGAWVSWACRWSRSRCLARLVPGQREEGAGKSVTMTVTFWTWQKSKATGSLGASSLLALETDLATQQNPQKYYGLEKPHLLEFPLELLVWLFWDMLRVDGKRGYWNLSLVSG